LAATGRKVNIDPKSGEILAQPARQILEQPAKIIPKVKKVVRN
jgi:hypothetical protein